jgi:hypothetical protein
MKGEYGTVKELIGCCLLRALHLMLYTGHIFQPVTVLTAQFLYLECLQK